MINLCTFGLNASQGTDLSTHYSYQLSSIKQILSSGHTPSLSLCLKITQSSHFSLINLFVNHNLLLFRVPSSSFNLLIFNGEMEIKQFQY